LQCAAGLLWQVSAGESAALKEAAVVRPKPRRPSALKCHYASPYRSGQCPDSRHNPGKEVRSMTRRDPDRLKRYAELITKYSGGLEAALESIRPPETIGGLESIRPTEERGSARLGLESMARGRTTGDQVQYLTTEAIINGEIRPAIPIVDGTFTVTHPLWSKLSNDIVIKARIESVIPSVGRIELPGNRDFPYGGTGFVVGEGVLMTNRHVAQIFADGLGDRRLSFKSGAKAGIDFAREMGRPVGRPLMVSKVILVHPYWDMAILKVDGLDTTHKPLKLSLTDARQAPGREIFVIGYPFFDPRNPGAKQQNLFNGTYGIKRLQPGQLHGAMTTASFGKDVNAATHDCSTLGGNSGSGVFDLATGEIMALHFGGLYHEENFGVPAYELSRDARVVDAGVQFNGGPSRGPNSWGSWWVMADDPDLSQRTEHELAPATPSSSPAPILHAPSPAPALSPDVSTQGGVVTIEVPLRISISLGAATPAVITKATTEAVAADSLEVLREPFHDADYDARTGYDPHFLGAEVPMPGAADASVLARTKAGGDVLDYENFSIKMQARRRLALITASNVTRETKLRKPEVGKDYTRRGLTDLGPNDQEKWYLDPRLDPQYQLPDSFFTKDRGSFDKGHLVRREDVAWGATYADLRRANGDSFHVTNCSPQVASFNRSAKGIDNWGDLENVVLADATSERLCILAGPVLDSKDQVFVGVGEGSQQLRAQIPSRFWKVIVAQVSDGLAAFGFILEQNLDDVQWEFTVPPEFEHFMTSLPDIEAMTGVAFAPALKAADQFDTVRGSEMSMRAGAKRRKTRA